MAASAPPPPRFILRGHEGACNCVAFQSESLLISGDVTGELRIWDLEARTTHTRLRAAHAHSILSVSRMPAGDAHQFLSCSRDGTVKLWSAATGQAALTLQTQAHCFCNASPDRASGSSADAHLVLTAAADESTVQLWDLRTGQVAAKATLAKHLGLVSVLHLHSAPHSQTGSGDSAPAAFLCALVGCDGGSVSMLDMRAAGAGGGTRSPLCTTAAVHDMQPVLAMDVAPTGRDVVTGGASMQVQRCELSMPSREGSWAGAEVAMGDSLTLPVAGTSGVAYRCDGRLCASGHWDGTVRLVEASAKGLKPLAILRHAGQGKESIFGVTFGLTGTASRGFFASASKDGTIALWDLYADRMRE